MTPDLSPASPLWLRPVMFDSECEVFGCSRSAEHSLFSPQALGLHPVRRVCRHHAEELVWLHGWMGYDRASGLAWRRTAR